MIHGTKCVKVQMRCVLRRELEPGGGRFAGLQAGENEVGASEVLPEMMTSAQDRMLSSLLRLTLAHPTSARSPARHQQGSTDKGTADDSHICASSAELVASRISASTALFTEHGGVQSMSRLRTRPSSFFVMGARLLRASRTRGSGRFCCARRVRRRRLGGGIVARNSRAPWTGRPLPTRRADRAPWPRAR